MYVKEGDVLAGKYRVERVLGEGGMGVVVAEMHMELEQRVALKFLLPAALQHPDQVARFAREARAAAKRRRDRVARVIDVGSLDTGVPYIVMEYLEGSDLSSYLGKQGPLVIAHAAALILEACDGLAEAHALGIVHRDLKPANLFLAQSPDGSSCLKILDFGISKVRSPKGEFDMTRTGALMGSPYYMSREQMRSSRAVDARTDIWSLGVILYELVSGRVPFDAPTLPQLCGMILTEPAHPLGIATGNIAPRFDALVSRCLEKEPDLRFQTGAELAMALAEFAPNQAGRSVERIVRRLGGTPPSSSQPAQTSRPLERSIRTNWGRTASAIRARKIGSAIVALVFVVAVASWVFRHKRGSSPVPHLASTGHAPSPPDVASPSASAESPAPTARKPASAVSATPDAPASPHVPARPPHSSP